MNKMLGSSAATILALAVAVPVFAGGSHCSGGDQTSASAASIHSCTDGAKSAAWAGAWLECSPSGSVTVAAVAKGSPAAHSGLKSGDIVVAVNGYNIANREDRAMCASKADCRVGNSVTYTVQRGRSTKTIKLKLEKMPATATERFASQRANFDPALAAMVIPAAN